MSSVIVCRRVDIPGECSVFQCLMGVCGPCVLGVLKYQLHVLPGCSKYRTIRYIYFVII